uniref:C3H1-type domain-containing protein n=1 Tax=Globisporangium ultimum (strain ATCC 200006 / CBS 805.95 / DAOM BR144) TaxID=431595 RepID=K3WU63_GLOUD
MGSQAWEGYAELHQALEGLACAKGTSANRIKAVAAAALKYAKDYKRVVHDVEMLYAIDAIIRQSQIKFAAKDPFAKRFSLHLSNTIAAVKKIPEESQQNVRHVLHEWQSRGFYTATQVEDAGGRQYSIASNSQPLDDQHHRGRESTETTPTASAGKLASLLSIIKKQKERKEQQDQQPPPSILGDAPSLLPSPTGPPHSQHERQSPTERSYLDRSAEYDKHQHPSERDTFNNHGDRRQGGLLPEPTSGHVRRDMDGGRDQYDESRAVKKPRGSRWGPPKANEDARPPPIDTAPHSRSGDLSPRYGAGGMPPRSPPRRRMDDAPQQNASFRPSPSGPPRRDDWHHAPTTTDHQRNDGFARGHPDHSRSPPMDKLRQPSPGGGRVGGYGYDKEAFHDNNRFAQDPSNPVYAPPPTSGRHDERHHQPMHSNAAKATASSGEKIPGTSGEVCRKFLAGRCTFGDRCWHIHNQQGGMPSRPSRVEMNEAKRKTVLCANFPKGTCRFGDNCSFAHGEHDLDRSTGPRSRGLPPTPGNSSSFDSSASRWQTRSGGNSNDSTTTHHQQQQASMSSAIAYDRGDRGTSGATSMSHANTLVSGTPPYPPYNNNIAGNDAVVAAPEPPGPQGYPSVGSVSMPRAQSVPVPATSAPMYPPPQINVPNASAGNGFAAAPSARASQMKDDDDDVEAEAPEFNLQYDDDE